MTFHIGEVTEFCSPFACFQMSFQAPDKAALIVSPLLAPSPAPGPA